MNFLNLLLFCFLILKNLVSSESITDIPLINYEMIPLQRWKVSAKELGKLKEQLKIFITSEIQKEGSALLQKYYKEFLIPDEEIENGVQPETLCRQNCETLSSENIKTDDEEIKKNIYKSFNLNGPVLLI
ncbi:conserved protein, unknown function [Hepatocystis sp. ex Piliocolobus tephrosceles]|nr:conserved protein, unknown function [Hepatocystis sp. ex Piliocolobus tephrosceles]